MSKWMTSLKLKKCSSKSVIPRRLPLYDLVPCCEFDDKRSLQMRNMAKIRQYHYYDVIMSTIASQITSLTIVCSTVYSDADQRKYQSSASLAFVRGIHRVNSPHKWPVTRKMFPFDDVIMITPETSIQYSSQITRIFILEKIQHIAVLKFQHDLGKLEKSREIF